MTSLEPALRRSLDQCPVVATAGIPDLEYVTGGLVGGDVWAVTSEPRQGRTTFACQMAAGAVDGIEVTFMTGVEGTAVAVPLVSSIARVPRLAVAGRARIVPSEHARMRKALSREVSVLTQVDVSLTQWSRDHGRGLLVIDDLDLWNVDLLHAVRQVKAWALTTGGAALVTIPSEMLGRPEFDLQAWVRSVDVQLRIHVPGSGVPGMAEIAVEHHRRGPHAQVLTAYEPWRARFAPLPDLRLPDRLPDAELMRLKAEPGWDPDTDIKPEDP